MEISIGAPNRLLMGYKTRYFSLFFSKIDAPGGQRFSLKSISGVKIWSLYRKITQMSINCGRIYILTNLLIGLRIH